MDDTVRPDGSDGPDLGPVPAALHRLVERYGSELGDDPRRVGALLRDLVGEHRAEIAAVVTAAEEGVPEALETASATMVESTVQRLVQNLTRNRALTPGAAEEAVRAWAAALGVQVLEVPADRTVAAAAVDGMEATQAAPEPGTKAAAPARPGFDPALLRWVAVGVVAVLAIFGVSRLVGGSGEAAPTTVAPTTTTAAGGYPQSVVAVYMAACTDEADEEFCRCTIDELQQRMPLEQFVALDEADLETNPVVLQVVAMCLRNGDVLPTLPTTTTTTTTTTLPGFTFVRVQDTTGDLSLEAPTVWSLRAEQRQIIVTPDPDAYIAEYNPQGWKREARVPGVRVSLIPTPAGREQAADILNSAAIPANCDFLGREEGELGTDLRYLEDPHECEDGVVYSIVVEWEPAVPTYVLVFEFTYRDQREEDAAFRAFLSAEWTRP
jgi:hypothetical protein